MEIKKARSLQVGKYDEEFVSTLYLERKWIAVSDILDWINNLRKSNDMWRYSVDECFGMLEEELSGKNQHKLNAPTIDGEQINKSFNG